MQQVGDRNSNSGFHNLSLKNKIYYNSLTTALPPIKQQEPDFKGWLYKWTNYIKGYQKRYFVLVNGILSYYRTQSEVSHTCRGSINLQGAFIDTIDSTSFVITNGGTQTFHLKATSEVERQRWVTALELAKAKSIREMESDDEDGVEDLNEVVYKYSPDLFNKSLPSTDRSNLGSDKQNALQTNHARTPLRGGDTRNNNNGPNSQGQGGGSNNNNHSTSTGASKIVGAPVPSGLGYQTPGGGLNQSGSPNTAGSGSYNSTSSNAHLNALMRALTAKLEDLVTCDDLVNKHGTALQKALAELETALAVAFKSNFMTNSIPNINNVTTALGNDVDHSISAHQSLPPATSSTIASNKVGPLPPPTSNKTSVVAGVSNVLPPTSSSQQPATTNAITTTVGTNAHALNNGPSTASYNPNETTMNTNPASAYSNTLAVKIKTVNERATLFKITANAIMNACAEYLELAQLQSKRWQKTIAHEREQKASLEEMVEQLAKQHSHLEKVAARNMASIMAATTSSPTPVNGPLKASPIGLAHNQGGGLDRPQQQLSNFTTPAGSGKDDNTDYHRSQNPVGNIVLAATSQTSGDEDEFFDATDVAAVAAANPVTDDNRFVVTMPRKCKSYHNRTPSGISNLSEGATHKEFPLSRDLPSGLRSPSGSEGQTDLANKRGSGVTNGSSESSDKDENEIQEATVVQVKDVNKFGPRAKTNQKPTGAHIENGASQGVEDDELSRTHSETGVASYPGGGGGVRAPALAGTALQQLHHAKPDYTLVIDRALLAELAKGAQDGPRKRRHAIPPKPNMSLNLWSIIKNCIGKDLSKIPMPVNFSEPLSMLQRLTEDFEYSEILDRAARIKDPTEQMCYVAAFTVSSYSTTIFRTSKPFNPLLGETYECDRSDDMGWCMVAEQVSHHPPTAAFYTESSEWVCWQEFTMSSKFRGKYLNIIPLGIAHLEFKSSGNHYTWRKVTSTVHNIIVGKLWMEHSGEMDIINHKTKDNCHLKYYSYSYFAREAPRKVTGVVTDAIGNAHWVLSGTWDTSIECAKVVDSDTSNKAKPILETLPPNVLWKARIPPPQNEAMYYFTQFALQLNEPEKGVAPTDSRNRPDQRLLEQGKWEQANDIKVKLEDKQRAVRRKKENEMERAAMEGKPYKGYEPIWFKKQQDPYTGNLIHLYKGQYYEKKAIQDWSECPDIYGAE